MSDTDLFGLEHSKSFSVKVIHGSHFPPFPYGTRFTATIKEETITPKRRNLSFFGKWCEVAIAWIKGQKAGNDNTHSKLS